MKTQKLLVLIGGLILILGSQLPWMSVPVLFGLQGPAYESIEVGWEDNGLITGGIGLILFLGAIFWRGKAKAGYSIPAVLLAVFALLIVIGCFLSILEMDPPAGFFAAADVGIYVSFIGSLLTLVGTIGAAGAVIMSLWDNQSYRKIIGRVLIIVICLRLLWFLPITQRVVISLLARPKEISVPVLTAPNAITPETVAGVHLLEHWGNGTFRSMAWSPDGRYFAVGTTSGVNLYEARTFQLLRYIDLPVEYPPDAVNAIDKLVFSPDGNSVAAVNTEGGEVLVVDLASDKILQHWKFAAPIAALAYLEDGTLVRVMNLPGGRKPYSIFKLTNGNWQLVKILDNDNFLKDIAFVPEKQAFVAVYLKSVRLIDPLSGTETTLPHILPSGDHRILTHDVILTHDALLIRDTDAYTDDQVVSAYKDGRLFKSIEWNDGAGQLTASPDDSLLAIIASRLEEGPGLSRSLEIKLWNIPSLQPARTISAGTISFFDFSTGPLVFSPVGDQLALLVSHSTIKVFSIAESQTREVVIKDPFASLGDIAITPQREIRAVRSSENIMEVLSLPSGNSIGQWHSDKIIFGHLLDGAGTVTVTVWEEGDAPITRLYRIGERKPPVLVKGYCCSTFSSDGNVGTTGTEDVVSTGDPYIVAIWQKNFAFYHEWKFSDTVYSAVSPSGQYVAAVTTSHTYLPGTYLWIHGIESGRQYPLLPARHISFSPDEKHLASTQGILDLETGQITPTEIVGEEGNDWYYAPAFSPDGQILAADSGGVLYFWRVSDGALLAKVDDPNYAEKKLVFSSDGTFLVGLGKGFVNVWGISKMNH